MDTEQQRAQRAARADPADGEARRAQQRAQERATSPSLGKPPCPRCGRYDTMYQVLSQLNPHHYGPHPLELDDPLPEARVQFSLRIYVCVVDGCVAYGSNYCEIADLLANPAVKVSSLEEVLERYEEDEES